MRAAVADVTTLFDQPSAVPEHRVRVLAQVVGAFRWPGRKSFSQLTAKQQEAATAAARACLERLAEEPD